MKICFFPCGNSGVGYYRCRQPMSTLAKMGHEVYELPILDSEENKAYALGVLDMADICAITSPLDKSFFEFIQSWKSIQDMEELEGKRVNKCKFVVDYDDNPFDLPPWNDKYMLWGRSEVKVMLEGEEKWIYKNGMVSHSGDRLVVFNATENDKKVRTVIPAIIRAADLITTTTPDLRNELLTSSNMNDFNGDKTAIMPNGIDLKKFDVSLKKRSNDGLIRIGWTLSSSHFSDWDAYRVAIGNVLRRNPNARLVIFGHQFGARRDIPLSQIEHVSWVEGITGYARTLAEYGIDIGLALLSDNRFNACKSPLKWEEYSALKIPAVVSELVYGGVVKDGETALIARDSADVEAHLQALIDSAELRGKIADAAYSEIVGKYDINIIAEKYEREFKNLLFKDKILKGGGSK